VTRPRRRLAAAGTALLVALAVAPGGLAQTDLPAPSPTLVAGVTCQALEGPCEYRYQVSNPPGAPAAVTAFALLEADASEVRSAAGWDARRDEGALAWRFEERGGVPAGWTTGGFVLVAPGLPKVGLAEMRAGEVARAAPTLVPGPGAERLGSAPELVQRLRDDLATFAGAGWIAPGPTRGILAARLATILDLLERRQETAARQRMRELIAETARLAPPVTMLPGRTPGGRAPAVRGATPVAPELRDYLRATLGLALARLGAIR
jgi:hypothetical protein